MGSEPEAGSKFCETVLLIDREIGGKCTYSGDYIVDSSISKASLKV